MNANIQLVLYLFIVLFAFGSSMLHFRRLSLALKFIVIFLGYTFITECVAAYWAYYYHQNLWVYHIYVPVSLGLIAFYYHHSFPGLKKYGLGYIVTAAGILVTLISTLYLQPLQELNTNATLFAWLCIIILSLYCFYRIYLDENDLHFARHARFWFALLFLFYDCTTFLIFGFMQYFSAHRPFRILNGLYDALWLINLIFYAGAGLVFLTVIPQKLNNGT